MTIVKTASVKQLTSYNIIINHPEAPIERYLVDGFSFDVVYLVKQAIKIAFWKARGSSYMRLLSIIIIPVIHTIVAKLYLQAISA